MNLSIVRIAEICRVWAKEVMPQKKDVKKNWSGNMQKVGAKWVDACKELIAMMWWNMSSKVAGMNDR